MPFIEDLTEGLAEAAGADKTVQRIERQKADRQKFSHEELQSSLNTYNDALDKLTTGIGQIDPAKRTADNPEWTRLNDALHKTISARTALFHPEHGPAAMTRLAEMLRLKKPGTQPANAGEAKQGMAELLGQAIPGPSSEEVKWKPLSGTKPFQDPNDKAWYQTMVDGQGNTKRKALPEGYNPPAEKVKPKKGLKYDALTDEVVDEDTAQRYPRDSKDAPEEVKAMFAGNKAATETKQKNAEHLAQVRGAAFGANRYVPVIDPNDPEAVTFMSAAKAASSGARSPQSIGFQIDKAVTKAFTSGPAATNLTYFNTATDHLKLLGETANALQNGNIPLVNQWANKYASATGSEAPNDFNTVRAAVSGELSKTFKGTGATDEEVKMIEGTINNTQSPEQLSGAIHYYTSLMDGKIKALRGQFEAAKKGEPNFPANAGEAKKLIKGETTSFSDGGTIYDIPADKVSAFKKKHPNAKEQ